MKLRRTFLHESKRKQAIRIVNVIHHDTTHKRDTSNTTGLYNKLISKLQSEEYKHYIDLPLHVHSWYQLCRYSPSRKFVESTWEECPIEEKEYIHPKAIIFCSTLNDDTDLRLREQLLINEKQSSHLEPISYFVYKTIKCNTNGISTGVEQRFWALMFFQVKSQNLDEIASEKIFDAVLEYQEVTSSFKWKAEIAGLLMGEYEGFILFSTEYDASLINEKRTELLNILEEGAKGEAVFHKFMPITLYFGTWEKSISIRAENLKIISELEIC